MYARVRACTRVYARVRACTRVYARVRACTRVYARVRACTRVYARVRACTRVYARVRACTRVYARVRACTRVYARVRACTRVYARTLSLMINGCRWSLPSKCNANGYPNPPGRHRKKKHRHSHSQSDTVTEYTDTVRVTDSTLYFTCLTLSCNTFLLTGISTHPSMRRMTPMIPKTSNTMLITLILQMVSPRIQYRVMADSVFTRMIHSADHVITMHVIVTAAAKHTDLFTAAKQSDLLSLVTPRAVYIYTRLW